MGLFIETIPNAACSWRNKTKPSPQSREALRSPRLPGLNPRYVRRNSTTQPYLPVYMFITLITSAFSLVTSSASKHVLPESLAKGLHPARPGRPSYFSNYTYTFHISRSYSFTSGFSVADVPSSTILAKGLLHKTAVSFTVTILRVCQSACFAPGTSLEIDYVPRRS